MIDPNEPAYPVDVNVAWDFDRNTALAGITIRAEIATRIAAGFAASGTLERQAIEFSVQAADMLIAELNKGK